MLHDKVAVIYGAGGAIGGAVARAFAEAPYTAGRGEETDAEALAGAPLISRWLPVVADRGHDLQARRGLLEGAMHVGAAVVLGAGERLFGETSDKKPMRLINTRTVGDSLAYLTCKFVRDA